MLVRFIKGHKMTRMFSEKMLMNTVASFEPVTFNAGSNLVQWTVPNGITKIHVDCVASKGKDDTAAGGNGGRVQCDLTVTAGQILYFTVGNIPTVTKTAVYNAADIRIGGKEYANRVIVAGGGGSSGHTGGRGGFYGGAGGGLTGQAGGKFTDSDPCNGGGGTQSNGGALGRTYSTYYYNWGTAGALGMGGTGGAYDSAIGGAGGAGYYGGGGGGCYAYYGSAGGGGGGGSSYTNANCSNVVHTQGYQDGAGYITISMVQ